MPIYEFMCPKCKARKEIITKETPDCDKCKVKMIKQISAPALIYIA